MVAWLLDHGDVRAAKFRRQLEQAWVISRCACGCASINFSIAGEEPPMVGMETLSRCYSWKDAEGNLCGIFVYAQGELLSGMEVFGYDDVMPAVLPKPEQLEI